MSVQDSVSHRSQYKKSKTHNLTLGKRSQSIIQEKNQQQKVRVTEDSKFEQQERSESRGR
jgi:hypothetical protein